MATRISTQYKRSSDEKLLKLSYQIVDTLKDNPLFPDPKPTHAVLLAAVDEYRMASAQASRSDRALSADKNNKKAALINLLDELAAYVTTISNGDKAMLLKSGFVIAGLKNVVQDLQPITSITVQAELPGQASVLVNKVPGAKSYVFQYTPDPILADSIWTSVTSLDREHTFNNLQPITRYWFRVLAIGKGNQTVYSPPVARVIN